MKKFTKRLPGTTLHLKCFLCWMSDVFPDGQTIAGQIIFGLLLIGGAVTAGLSYYFTPSSPGGISTDPASPFSHSVHVNQLGWTAATVTTALKSLGTQTYRSRTRASTATAVCFQTIPNLNRCERVIRIEKPISGFRFIKYLITFILITQFMLIGCKLCRVSWPCGLNGGS